MKKPADQLKVVNPKGATVPEALGIADDRKDAVIKRTQEIIKNNISDGKDKPTTISDVWNEFENPAECAFALYIMTHAEEEIMVHELFRLPMSVGEEEKA